MNGNKMACSSQFKHLTKQQRKRDGTSYFLSQRGTEINTFSPRAKVLKFTDSPTRMFYSISLSNFQSVWAQTIGK